jgi:hypothetical protein
VVVKKEHVSRRVRAVALAYLPFFVLGWVLAAGDEKAKGSVRSLVRWLGAGLLVLLAGLWLACVIHALLRRRWLSGCALLLLNFFAVPFYLWRVSSEA